MTKKSKKILTIIAAFLVLVSVAMLIMPKHFYTAKINNVVEVKDGIATPGKFATVLTVNTTAEYSFSANWWKDDVDPGFVTGLMVTDESGKSLYTVTGGKLFSDSVPMRLEKGKYTFSFETMGSPDAYTEYVKRNFGDSDIGDIDRDYFRDGVWEMEYKVEINQYFKGAYAFSLAAGVVFGILIIALVVVASRKEDAPVKKYDERQVAAQGRAYKRGFIVMVIYCGVMVSLNVAKIVLPVEESLVMLLGICLGGIVTVTGLIIDDAYFRMDENRSMWIIFLSLLSVTNLGIGISQIVRQEIVSEGVVTLLGSANLICGVFMVYILVVILIKSIKDKEEE